MSAENIIYNGKIDIDEFRTEFEQQFTFGTLSYSFIKKNRASFLAMLRQDLENYESNNFDASAIAKSNLIRETIYKMKTSNNFNHILTIFSEEMIRLIRKDLSAVKLNQEFNELIIEIVDRHNL